MSCHLLWVLWFVYFEIIKEFLIIHKFRWQGHPSRCLHCQVRTCCPRHHESFDCQELHQGRLLQIHRRMQWRKEGSHPCSSFSIRQQDRWCSRLPRWYRRLRMQSQARIIRFMVPKWQEDQQGWFQVYIFPPIFKKIGHIGNWPEIELKPVFDADCMKQIDFRRRTWCYFFDYIIYFEK